MANQLSRSGLTLINTDEQESRRLPLDCFTPVSCPWAPIMSQFLLSAFSFLRRFLIISLPFVLGRADGFGVGRQGGGGCVKVLWGSVVRVPWTIMGLPNRGGVARTSRFGCFE